MSNPQNKISVWGVAIGGSLLIHFVLLGLLAMTAGGNAPEPSVTDAPAPREEMPRPSAESSAAEPVPSGSAAPRTGTTPIRDTASRTEEVKTGETVTYVVKQGDNLTRIARACGATAAELAELNGKPLKRLEKLWVGQKIKLPRPISEQKER